MIHSISIHGFKSYKEASLEFAPLTFMIGANASGKSNALEAIRLLSWLAKGYRLDDIERKVEGTFNLVRGQSRDLFYKKKRMSRLKEGKKIATPIVKRFQIGCTIAGEQEDWNVLNMEVSIIGEHLIITQEYIQNRNKKNLYWIDDTIKIQTDEIGIKYDNFMKGPNKPQIPCSNRQAIFYQLDTPGRFFFKHVKSQETIPKVCKAFRDALKTILFLDPQPSLMRGYSYANGYEFKEDGSNLSSVLYSIWESNYEINNVKLKDHLLDFIRSHPEQDIQGIDFIKTERNDVMVRLVESFGGNKYFIDAPLLSDGTLRVLSVAAALLSAPENTLVIIEEIDNGIHPSRADRLIHHIKTIAESRNLQVLLTSHNPALLDALPDECLGDVLCCYRDPEEGDSRMIRLQNLDRFPELVASGSLGQIVTQGILDRFLKDKSSPDQRRKTALKWLADYKKEVAQ